jgi:hypothetical protein
VARQQLVELAIGQRRGAAHRERDRRAADDGCYPKDDDHGHHTDTASPAP